MLARLMMLPDDLSTMPGASPATKKYAERTLPLNRSSNVASSRFAVGPNQDIPALFTKTSTGPTASIMPRSASRSLRSAATNRPRPPCAAISWTTSAPRSGSRPCTTTSHPSPASRTAVARPMPEVAPVTSARPNRVAASLLAVLVTIGSGNPRRGVSPQLIEDVCHVGGGPLLDDLPVREAIAVDLVPPDRLFCGWKAEEAALACAFDDEAAPHRVLLGCDTHGGDL